MSCPSLSLNFFRCPLISHIFLTLRKSILIPLHKKGGRSDIRNYRGIAKLSAIPKLFELFITNQIQHQCSSMLSPFQHGFMKRRSTLTNLLELTSMIRSGFQNKLQTEFIFTDFSKAFDSVSHILNIITL